MVKLKCNYCGKVFERNSTHKQYKNTYCSKICEANYRRNKPKPNKKLNDIEVFTDYAIIHIYNSFKGHIKCLIDVKDIEKIKNLYWNIRYDKRHPNCTIYVESHTRVDGKIRRIHLHRLIMDCPKGLFIDHIDGDGLNNKRNNLRIVTHKENMQNKHIRANN